MPDAAFGAMAEQLRTAIADTRALDERGATVHRGYKFDTLIEILDELLKDNGISADLDSSLF